MILREISARPKTSTKASCGVNSLLLRERRVALEVKPSILVGRVRFSFGQRSGHKQKNAGQTEDENEELSNMRIRSK